MKTQIRIRRRKNFFPTLLLSFLSWLGWGFFVYSVAPDNNLSLLIFFLLLFIAVFFTSALIFANSRRGLLFAFLTIVALVFRYYQIGNLLNLILLLITFLVLEVYLSHRES